MKKLDELMLDEIIGFDVQENTLRIETKTETYIYKYETALEVLRKLSYFLHRYNVEYYHELEEREAYPIYDAKKYKEALEKMWKDLDKSYLSNSILLLACLLMFQSSPIFGLWVINAWEINNIHMKYNMNAFLQKITPTERQYDDYQIKREKYIVFEQLKRVTFSYLAILIEQRDLTQSEKIIAEEIGKSYQKSIENS